MEAFWSNGFIQVLTVVVTVFGGYVVARVNRTGSKEANQTTGWTNLVAALQKQVEASEKRQDDDEKNNQERFKELDTANRDLARRVISLEKNRRAWKWWGQRVVVLLRDCEIPVPETPESLEDTDPNLNKTNGASQ